MYGRLVRVRVRVGGETYSSKRFTVDFNHVGEELYSVNDGGQGRGSCMEYMENGTGLVRVGWKMGVNISCLVSQSPVVGPGTLPPPPHPEGTWFGSFSMWTPHQL